MNIKEVLIKFKKGEITLEDTLKTLRWLLYKDLFFAKVDISRSFRRGFPEVIFAQGKTPDQIRKIVLTMLETRENVMITRASEDVFRALSDIPNVKYHKVARIITIENRKIEKKGLVAVVTGGTADIPIAEEAAITAEFFGTNVIRIYDVGVAGIHRLFDNLDKIYKADIVIVCAGMDSALFSVVAGLIDAPVIAVPTSVGYGSHLSGLTSLLSALNTCVPGVVVVNIDNGFGAGYFAALTIRKLKVSSST